MKFEEINIKNRREEIYYFPNEISYTFKIKNHSLLISKEIKETIKFENIIKRSDILKKIENKLSSKNISYHSLNITYPYRNDFIVSENYVECKYSLENIEFFTELNYELISVFGSSSNRALLKLKKIL